MSRIHNIDVSTSVEQNTCVGFQTLSSLSTATRLTIPNGARFAMISVEAQDVRWLDDGNNPSASVGMPMSVGDTMWFTGTISEFRVIEQASGARVSVGYYG